MNAQGLATSFAISIFPFHSELSKQETTDESVLVVDVGGGLGHATKQIKALCGEVEGKIILQDRSEVLDDIKEDLGEGIEKMAHDFFTPNPVKGISPPSLSTENIPLTRKRFLDILHPTVSP